MIEKYADDYLQNIIQKLALDKAKRLEEAIETFVKKNNLTIFDHYRIVIIHINPPILPIQMKDDQLIYNHHKIKIELNKKSKFHYLLPIYYFLKSKAYRRDLVAHFLKKGLF